MNENLFAIGLAMFVALAILWLGYLVLSSTPEDKFTRFIYGTFSLYWLYTTLFIVWFSLMLPKPKGNAMF